MSKNAPVKRGEIVQVDGDGSRYRVKFPDEDGVTSFWLDGPAGATTGKRERGAMFKAGSQVWCLVDWDGEAGCVVQAAYNDQDKSPTTSAENDHVAHEDGAVAEHDPVTHINRLSLPATGKRLIEVGDTRLLITKDGIVANKPITMAAIPPTPMRGKR